MFNQVNSAKLVGGVEEGRKGKEEGRRERRSQEREKGKERRKGESDIFAGYLEDVLQKKTPRTTRNYFVAENRLFHRRVLETGLKCLSTGYEFYN